MTGEVVRDNEYQKARSSPRLVADIAEIQTYLPLLIQEFCHSAPETYNEKLLASLKVNGAAVFSNPSTNPRGAEMFVLEKQDYVVAVSVSKYYSWDLLKDQLHLQPTITENGEVLAFRVRSMGGLLADAGLDASRSTVATELAYNYVIPDQRGKGYGKAMFAARIQRLAELKGTDDCVLFTMARGAHIDAGIGTKIFKQLIQKERELYGAQENEKKALRRISMLVTELATSLDISPETTFTEVHQSSKPILRFAAAHKMQFVGIFKDLSPIFATI